MTAPCNCYYGEDCTRTTVCANESVVQDLEERIADQLCEIERLQARVDELEGVLDRVDYALENIWAIDRDRLRHLIAEAATEQGERDE